jgi:hypothetical protein
MATVCTDNPSVVTYFPAVPLFLTTSMEINSETLLPILPVTVHTIETKVDFLSFYRLSVSKTYSKY